MDLHDQFDDWLAAGAEGEPPRDLAVHASGCDACLRSIAAVDSLQAIDIGAASLPPLRMVAAAGRDSLARTLRYAVGAVAVVLLGTSVAIGASGLLRPTQLGSDPGAQSPGEGVLAGAPSAPATSQPLSAGPTASASDSPKPKQSATEESSTALTTAVPFQVLPHSTPSPQPPGTPPPTAAPPTPAPTAAPTASPTVAPSTSPSASSPTDSDGDGVADEFDICPAEPAGQSPDPLRPGCPPTSSPSSDPSPSP